MEGPRSARIDEFNQVIDLINNVFRITRNQKPTMQYEFPYLLNEKNINNMIVIKEDNKIVADVNYLKQNIVVQGANIIAASIGAVCTNSEYRGRRYSSKILDKVEEQMKSEGIDVVLISGTRDLYRRRMCSMVKSHYKYEITPNNEHIDFEIKEYEEEHLNKMIQLYNLNSTRYLRTYEEFKELLDSATIPWGTFSYKKYVITKQDEVIGYLIIRVIDDDKKYGQVIEAYGDSNTIYMALRKLAYDLQLENVCHYVHIKEYNNQFDKYDKRELDCQQGTLKIINFEKFMKDLNTYFIQYVRKDILDKTMFTKEGEGYLIQFEDEKVIIDNVESLNKLIFQGNTEKIKYINECSNIKKFIETVFPIPFVWSANLNYQ
ncbi:GNAT family N-acetyltransferase [Oceanirhabdus seepicola]|uniref:GNAT family N-acetyltransferase n=1 Tax=Oceanirhabdus seepicola TaxID=2828781 RepID=A0A9J6P526_9CLOT|nr:GNAT family N-acetyltransferase [Oceanirhabdus seepicola]MCM1991246.1 GNAT family N-acetyltransferase [Oceanirhabdus seepicola]